MVRHWLLLLWLFPGLLQAAELALHLDKTRAQLGKIFKAHIVYISEKTPDAPDLSAWRKDFFIDRGDTDETLLKDGRIETDFSLRLFPRHSGSLKLDDIALGGAIANGATLQVSPPIHSGVDATPRLQALKPYYWADEAIDVRIRMAVYDARNVIKADDFELPGFAVMRLPDRHFVAAKQPMIELHWRLSTLQKGRYRIELPAITQRGRGRYQFHLPRLTLHIKPLPAYLPANVAVGQPSLTSQLSTDAQQPALTVTVQNSGRLPAQLAGLDEALQPLGDALSAPQVLNQNRQGVAIRQYRITLRPWLWPQRPLLKLVYFDTESGRQKTLHQRLPLLWNAPARAKWALLALLLLLTLWLMKRLYRAGLRWRERRRWRRQLLEAQDAHQLRRLLINRCAVPTLQAWQQQCASNRADALVERLNRACFSAQADLELAQLKKDCVKF